MTSVKTGAIWNQKAVNPYAYYTQNTQQLQFENDILGSKSSKARLYKAPNHKSKIRKNIWS